MTLEPEFSPEAIEAALSVLKAHPDFKILRRLKPDTISHAALQGAVARAVVVDTETTGTHPDADQIIELALIAFEYEPVSGKVGRVLDIYDALEDPGRPIPPESTAIHGITDDMVVGQRIDDARVRQLLEGVSLVIAHNAQFDRPFLERRLPLFAEVPWACSFAQIPWSDEGIAGRKLEYLAAHHGFFYDAHRSEIDCHALLEILRRPLPRSGVIALASLLKASAEPCFRLWATGSPFETKDLLRARGYRWDAERRCWHRAITKALAKDEAEWLKAQVFANRACQIEVETLDALVNFSSRAGKKTVRAL